MKLYGYFRSSSTWRVRIVLALKGVPYETVPIDLLAGDQREPGYRAVNPLGQVPALELEVDGEVRRLAQSIAICDYLDRRFPEPPLFPTDLLLRARALQLAEIVNSGIQPLQNNEIVRRLEAMGQGLGKAWAAGFVARGLTALEAEVAPLAGRFSIGDRVTLADVYLVPQLYNARRFHVELAPYPTLARVEAACLDLPAFATTHPDRARSQP